MRASLFCLVLILHGHGCSLTRRNPLACLFDGPPVCGAGMTCDVPLNQCVPITDMAAGEMTLPDMACSSAFCIKTPPQEFNGDNLRGIWGSSASNIFVIRGSRQIQHWNGSSWESPYTGTDIVQSIFGVGANNALAADAAGTIYEWNGASFMIVGAVNTNSIHGIWGDSPVSSWLAGDGGVITRRTSGTLNTNLFAPTYGDFFGIWGADAQHIWAVSNLGKVGFYNGTTWSPTNLAGGTLFSISGTSATDVWAVGVSGFAFHFDGTSWTAKQNGLIGSPSLESVWAVDANTAWAVGDGGVYKWEKTTWSLQQTPVPSVKYHGVWNLNGRETWVVGDSGTFLYLGSP